MRDGPSPILRVAIFLLFTASGVTGLIYESIWTHYLKLVLGHAAYAQTLVLAIFMGGLALGAWLSGRNVGRFRRPLRAYALAEAGVGLAALLFHPLFLAFREWLYTGVLGGALQGFPAELTKWMLCALLVLPQSILLGTTFPWMSAAALRLWPERTGSTLSLLYFSNSLGAAAGALITVFWLVPWAGLPGTITLAGAVNLLIAAVAWLLGAMGEPSPNLQAQAPGDTPAPPNTEPARHRLGFLCAASLITGAASLLYEVGWIRMLSMVLGSSTQAFEIMLSAFITGLAFGSLAVRGALGRIRDAVHFAGVVQLAMALLSVLTLPLYNRLFDVMGWLIKGLAQTDAGYVLFTSASHALALAVMVPATFMAGMTLPLFTHAALGSGHGERSIGSIYAANTLGCIAGVLLGQHVLMPLLGLKWVVGLGSLLDAGLGALLLAAGTSRATRLRRAAWPAAVSVGVVLIAAGSQLDVRRMAAGVYQTGNTTLHSDAQLPFHRDGKTASVDLIRWPNGDLSIATNGKIDATVGVQATSVDDPTMVLAGALPLALQPDAKRAAVIGLGSGLTTQTLLAWPGLTRVDTIEIEPAMIEGARGFGRFSERVYRDPRSHLHVDDAKAFFAARPDRYDIIISEPSNPWVSGVAGLFTTEFYAEVARKLSPNGMLLQWIQLYETNLEVVASSFKAVTATFEHVAFYSSNGIDAILVASQAPLPDALSERIFAAPALANDLARIHIHGTRDLAARALGDGRLWGPLFDSIEAPPNSDYFPFVAERAPRARFLVESAPLADLLTAPVPVLEMLAGQPVTELGVDPFSPRHRARANAEQLLGMLREEKQERTKIPQDLRTSLTVLQAALACAHAVRPDVPPDQAAPSRSGTRAPAVPAQVLLPALLAVHEAVSPFVTPGSLRDTWASLATPGCVADPDAALDGFLRLVRALDERDAPRMAEAADALLASGHARSRKQIELALSAGLLGELATQGTAAAFDFGKRHALRYRASKETPVHLRLLIAQSTPAFHQLARNP